MLMKVLKQYWLVLLVTFITGTAILIKSYSTGTFRYDAVRWAEQSVGEKNLIAEDAFNKLNGDILLINLNGSENPTLKVKQVSIQADSVLSNTYKKLIFRHNGPVILSADDQHISGTVWMVLSQMGRKNIYILND